VLALCLVRFPENFQWEAAGSTWTQLKEPESWQFTAFFGLSALLALGESAHESQSVAVLQSFFQTENEQKGLAAVANVKVWQSLGFAVQFAVSTALQLGMPGEQNLRRLILGCVLSAGLVWVALSVVCLHWRVASLDQDRGGASSQRDDERERETLQTSQTDSRGDGQVIQDSLPVMGGKFNQQVAMQVQSGTLTGTLSFSPKTEFVEEP